MPDQGPAPLDPAAPAAKRRPRRRVAGRAACAVACASALGVPQGVGGAARAWMGGEPQEGRAALARRRAAAAAAHAQAAAARELDDARPEAARSATESRLGARLRSEERRV